MTESKDFQALQACIGNRIDFDAIATRKIAGVIGDAPSHYSKSPALWNAAFRALDIEAVYFPFDVEASRLADLLRAIKDSSRVMGVNVTVPYKIRIMEWLDDLDPDASRIQAVNTVVRTDDGRLIGHNTDGEGFLESILTPHPGGSEPFLDDLAGLDVLLLGAGGSARAVAFHVADLLAQGRLIVCNRTLEHASTLAAEVSRTGTKTLAISEDELPLWAPKVGLIINTTVKGQGGKRKLADGTVTLMEPYSALSPAHPAALPAPSHAEAEFLRKWFEASRSDVEENNRASHDLAASIPPHARFCDLIYHPEETVFLRHGRLTGHKTHNGKGMIVGQAAIAFCNHVCQNDLSGRGLTRPETLRRVYEIMYQAW